MGGRNKRNKRLHNNMSQYQQSRKLEKVVKKKKKFKTAAQKYLVEIGILDSEGLVKQEFADLGLSLKL